MTFNPERDEVLGSMASTAVSQITAANLQLLSMRLRAEPSSSTLVRSEASSSDSDSYEVAILPAEAYYRLPSYSDYSASSSKDELDFTVSEHNSGLRPRYVAAETLIFSPETNTSLSSPDESFAGTTFVEWDGYTSSYDPSSLKGTPRIEGPIEDDKAEVDAILVEDQGRNRDKERRTELGSSNTRHEIKGTYELNKKALASSDSFWADLEALGLDVVNHDGQYPECASDMESFKNGLIEVKKSPISGYGVFAARQLDAHTHILVEKELLHANNYDLYAKYEALTEAQKTAYKSLHGHKKAPETDTRAAIWHTNNFSLRGGGSLFLVASRFNHACNPNVAYWYDFEKKCMVFTTKKAISAGSELFIRYSCDRDNLFLNWGFWCTCDECKDRKPTLFAGEYGLENW
ncbi:hypothetical protein GGS20DRAFT_595252 [Poronia punctata]|nr:hypothetical protein GGS20DRAFT_595252 [Poronia punctata]